MDVIYQWFEKQVQYNPNAIAIKHHGRAISYRQLNQKANALAFQLQTLGVMPDTLIATCLPRSSEQLIAILGILIAGGAYVPFDPTHQEARINRLLEINQISLIITSNEHAARFKHAQMNVLCIENRLPRSHQKRAASSDVKPHHLAYLIHTSGSTGTPKGVLIEQHSVINYCRWFQQYTGLKPGCIVDYSSNYIFDMAVTTSLLPLLWGCTIVVCDDEIKQNPRAYLGHLKTKKIQLIKLTPSYLKTLLQEIAEYPIELPDLSVIILGGENLSAADCQAWLQYFPHHVLFNEYGPSETTVGVMHHQITINNVNQHQPNVPIGKPGSNIVPFILDETLHPVNDGEIGELYLGGECLSQGYHRQPELTAERFITSTSPLHSTQRLYKTGDLCRKNKAGVFEYFGRVDRQIKIHGYRIELGEIEYWLRQHPIIQDALIVLSDHLQQNMLCAYCILQPTDTLPSYTEIRSYLLNFLPHYMIPSTFIPLNTFPLTSNGKLDQTALPLPQINRAQSKHAPLSKLEQALIQIWSEELGVEHIGVHDNFYALGGHSLHAARIVSTILQKIGKKLSLAEFYQTETITNLATLLKHRQKKSLKGVFNKQKHAQHPSSRSFSSLSIFNYWNLISKKSHSRHRNLLSDFQLLLWISKTFEPKVNRLNLVSRKRVQGYLNSDILQHAFMATLQRHEIFFQRIAAFYPAYLKQPHQNIALNEITLSHLSLKDCESILLESIQGLIQLHPWPKNHPLVMLKLFYLPEDTIELQLCIPHLIADEISLNIFWRDFSHYYLIYSTYSSEILPKHIQQITPTKSFQDYVRHEQQNISTYFEQDCEFWDTYLQNSELMTFPEDFIVRRMSSDSLAYSTYYAFPSSLLHALQEYCIQHHVGIEDVLCVAADAALRHVIQNQHQVGVINMVKSTRQDSIYDETIGCFLRVDPIKIEKNQHISLLDLSRQIRQTILKNTHFSQASTILKLAFLAAKNNRQKKNLALKSLISVYGLFLNKLHLEYKVLQLGAYFSSFKRDNRFIIYMNLWQNFISYQPSSEYLGLPHQTTPMLFHDLSAWDNVCDISFLRDEHQNQPYVVVSSNLRPEVRKKIAETICTTLLTMIENQ